MRLASESDHGDDARATLESVGALYARLLAFRTQCTCDRTPVTECPNYVPGDELLFNGRDRLVRMKNPRTNLWEDKGPADEVLPAQTGRDTEGRLVHTALGATPLDDPTSEATLEAEEAAD